MSDVAWSAGLPRAEVAQGARRQRRFLLALLAILGAALLLRLALLDRTSLTLDEGFTRYWIEHGQAFLWGEGRHLETNPPLYFSLLHGWAGLFGTSDVALRFPSAMASVALVAMGGWLGRQVAGRAAGLLAAALLAIWPLSLWHGIEARPVALVPLFEAVALIGAFLWVRRVAGRPVLAQARARVVAVPFALVVLGCVAAIHTHATALFFTAALGVTLAGALILRRGATLSDLGPVVAAGALIGLLSAPQLLVFLEQRGSGNLAWIPPLSPWMLQSFVVPIGPGMVAFELPPWLRLSLLGLLLAVAALGAARLRDRAAIAVLVVVPVLFVAALVVASLGRPVLLPRVAVVLLLPFAILVAIGVLAWPAPAWRIGTGALVFGVLAFGLWMQVHRPASASLGHTLRPDYRAVVRFLQDESRCAGPVFTGHAWTLLGWPHYGAPGGRQLSVVLFPEEEDFRVNFFFVRHAPRAGIGFVAQEEFSALVDTLPASVILVQRSPRSSRPMRAQIAARAPQLAVERHAFGQGMAEIEVYCLRARAAGG
jgi:uncharacterized membrane protein